MSDAYTLPIAEGKDPRRQITNIYIITMLLLFPLFTGFSGYSEITFSKYLFFVIATALWIISLAAANIFGGFGAEKFRLWHWLGLAFMAIVCISAVLSPYKPNVLIGCGRYDGLITQLLYAAIFIGVSMYGRPEKSHFIALGISLTICCAVAVFQLFNINILGLFPGDYSHYDKGIRYSSAFLGTIGNTNVLSEYLCVAVPALFALPVVCGTKLSLLSLAPIFLSIFVMIRADVSGGIVALGCCALVGAPIVLTDMCRVRRGLALLAFAILPLMLALAFCPEYEGGVFSFSFRFGKLSLLLAMAAAALLVLSLILGRVSGNVPTKKLRLVFGGISACAVVVGLILVYFTPATEGTVYELSRLLHGEAEDSFGSSRILIWRECLEAWKAYPLFGSGPDTLSERIDIDFSRYVEETGKTLSTSVDNAHNIYLGYLVNTGLAGALSYLAMLLSTFRAWLKNTRSPLVCALGLGFVCSCVQGFFGLGLCLSAPVFWISTALILGGTHD